MTGLVSISAEIGDFDSQRLLPGYVSEFQFVPNQTEELEEQIAAFHRRLRFVNDICPLSLSLW